MAQPTSNPFASATASTFGQPASNPFGAPSTQNANPFSAAPASAPSFGAPAQPTNIFAAAGQPASSGFGAPAQQANNIFGAPPTSNVFGASTPAMNNAFGSTPSSVGSNPVFGAPSTQLSAFGTPAASAPISRIPSPANPTIFTAAEATSKPAHNPFGAPATLAPTQNPFGQPSSSSVQTPNPFQQPLTQATSIPVSSANTKTDSKKRVTFGGKQVFQNGPTVNEPRPSQDKKRFGNGPTREPSENTRKLSSFAFDYAKKLLSQLERDKIRPPKGLPQNGDASKMTRGAFESLKEAYKKYRTRVYDSLRKVDLIDDPEKRRRLEDALPFKGVCEDMCPEFEQVARIAESDVKKEERVNGHPEPSAMVKKFGRSAAGQDAPLPMDVRSVDALRKTTDYLFKDLLQSDENLPSMHNFLWDRTRAVRKDFTFHSQKTKGEMEVLVYVFETITRFHATSLHLLSRPNYAQEDFDQKQEIEQLGRTLLSLIEAYDTCKEMNIHCPNEAEFRAYYFLLNYHDSSIRMRSLDEQNGEPWFQSPYIQTALSLIEAMDDLRDDKGPLKPRRRVQMSDSGCGKYFQIVEDPSVSYTMACVAAVHFTYVRQNVLRTLVKCYSRHRDAPRTITASILNEFLRFDTTQEAVEFAELHEFEFTSEYPEGKPAPPEPYIRLDRKNKYVPSPRVKHAYSGELVERKRGGHSLAHVIYNTVFEEPKQSVAVAGDGKPADELFVAQPTDDVATSSPSTDGSRVEVSSSTTLSPTPSPVQPAKPSDIGSASQPGLVPAAADSPKFPAPVLKSQMATNPAALGSIFGAAPQPAPIFGSTTPSTPPQPAPKLGSILGSAPAPAAPQPPSMAPPLPSGFISAAKTVETDKTKPATAEPQGGNDAPKVLAPVPAPPVFSAVPKDNAAIKAAAPAASTGGPAAVPTPAVAFPATQPVPPAVSVVNPTAPQIAQAVASAKPQSASALTSTFPAAQPATTAPQPTGALQAMAPKPEVPKRDLMGDFTKWYVAGDEGMLTDFMESMVENLVSGAFANWQQEEAEKKRKEEDERSWEEARKYQQYNLSVKYFYRWRKIVADLATKRILREGKEKMKAYRERERVLAKEKKEEEERAARAERKAARRRIMEDGNRLGELASQQLSATEHDLLASGIFSGLRDERGAVRNVVREAANGTDWHVATFSPDYAESELELEPPRRSLMAATASTESPDYMEKKEGWKTKSLRQKFGVEQRRSLSASSSINGSVTRFRQSLPASAMRTTNFSRKRSASESSEGEPNPKRKTAGKVSGFKSTHWDLRARGFVPLPNGDWVPEAVANSKKDAGMNEETYEAESIRDDESLGSHGNEDVVLRMRERLARLKKSYDTRPLSHHSVARYEAASPSPQNGSRAVFSTSPTPAGGSGNNSFSKRKRDSDDDGSQDESSPNAKKSYIRKSETGAMVEDLRRMLRELHDTMDQLDEDTPVIREHLEMGMLGNASH